MGDVWARKQVRDRTKQDEHVEPKAYLMGRSGYQKSPVQPTDWVRNACLQALKTRGFGWKPDPELLKPVVNVKPEPGTVKVEPSQPKPVPLARTWPYHKGANSKPYPGTSQSNPYAPGAVKIKSEFPTSG